MTDSPAQASPDSPPQLSRKRKWQFTALTLGLLLLALLGLEVICRFYYHGRFPEDMIHHSVRHHSHRPLWRGWEGPKKKKIWTQFNSLGLRSPKEYKASFKGKRILLLGDSVVFGYRLKDQDCFSSQLQRALEQAAPEQSWQCVNAGCYGYGVQDEHDWLKELSQSLKFDLVILGLCYNDFAQPTTKIDPKNSAFVQLLQDNSGLAFAVNRKFVQYRRQLKEWSGSRRRHQDPRSQKTITKAEGRAAAQQIFEHLKATRATTDKLKVPLLLFLWPGRQQLEEYTESKTVPEEQSLLFEKWRARYPNSGALLPYEELRKAGQGAGLYMDHCHPSVSGVSTLTPYLRELVLKSLH